MCVYLVNIVVVIEVGMEAYFVGQDQDLDLDWVPFCSHAYEVVVAVVFDNYLELPFRLA